MSVSAKLTRDRVKMAIILQDEWNIEVAVKNDILRSCGNNNLVERLSKSKIHIGRVRLGNPMNRVGRTRSN